MNPWHDIPSERINKDHFECVIEITAQSKNKYELDKETGLIRLDRILYTSTHYPANYGFIPKTYAEDNDPLDVLVLCSQPLNPLTLVECYPIGIIKMVDDGFNDEKIIAVAVNDPVYNSYKDVKDLPSHVEDEIRHFFQVYKMLEYKETIIEETGDRQEAEKVIQKSINRYKRIFKNY